MWRLGSISDPRQLWANFSQSGFLSDAGPVAVSGDTARAQPVAREVIRMVDGSVFKLIGTYDDYLVRAGDRWQSRAATTGR